MKPSFGSTILLPCRWRLPFNYSDGIQTVATGALRGRGRHTHADVFATSPPIWIIGLPLGAWLCFRRGMGVAFGPVVWPEAWPSF